MLSRPFAYWRSPMREMERLRREMDRLFSQLPSGTGLAGAPSYPAMNVWLNEDSVIVTAELPGCNPDELDISVINDTLTLSGNRVAEELPEGAVYHRRERGCGRFTRTFQLPFQIDAGKVEAHFDKGVLQVTLPRAEEDKPKKIQIKAG